VEFLTPAQGVLYHASGGFIAGGSFLNVPDYVFKQDYKLIPLSALASYVGKEKYLPDIPSAQEISEQRVNVSELQMELLKKGEELSSYTVEQNGEIVEQEKTNRQQETIVYQQ